LDTVHFLTTCHWLLFNGNRCYVFCRALIIVHGMITDFLFSVERSRSGKSEDIIIDDTISIPNTNNLMHEPTVAPPRPALEGAPVGGQDRFLRTLLCPKEPSLNSLSSSNSSYNGSNASGKSYMYPMSMRNAEGPHAAPESRGNRGVVFREQSLH
jgi:hypothetical protein